MLMFAHDVGCIQVDCDGGDIQLVDADVTDADADATTTAPDDSSDDDTPAQCAAVLAPNGAGMWPLNACWSMTADSSTAYWCDGSILKATAYRSADCSSGAFYTEEITQFTADCDATHLETCAFASIKTYESDGTTCTDEFVEVPHVIGECTQSSSSSTFIKYTCADSGVTYNEFSDSECSAGSAGSSVLMYPHGVGCVEVDCDGGDIVFVNSGAIRISALFGTFMALAAIFHMC